MFKKSLAVVAALSFAAAPALAAPSAGAPVVGASSASSLSLQPPPQSNGRGNAYGRDNRNLFAAPGAGIGIALFAVIVVLGILLATGTLFGDDDDNSISA